jgi:hypothetical protein
MVRLRATCFAVALGIVLAGCTSSPPNPVATPGVLVGTWVADGPGSSQGKVELNSDGSMTADSLPIQVVLGPAGEHWFDPIDWSDVSSFRGKWWARENGSDQPYVSVAPSTPVGGRTGFGLDVRSEGGEWIVYYAIGGPDTGQILDFHRTTG